MDDIQLADITTPILVSQHISIKIVRAYVYRLWLRYGYCVLAAHYMFVCVCVYAHMRINERASCHESLGVFRRHEYIFLCYVQLISKWFLSTAPSAREQKSRVRQNLRKYRMILIYICYRKDVSVKIYLIVSIKSQRLSCYYMMS